MAIPQPIFVNGFQKGSSENANIGNGTFLGVETYSKKGVAQLTKDTTKVSGTVVTDLIRWFANQTTDIIWGQGDTGKVYRSTNAGATWSLIPGNSLIGASGNGLIVFGTQSNAQYVFAFRNLAIDIYDVAAASWTNDSQTGLIGGDHFPLVYPSQYGFYFANGNQLGFFGQTDPATPFNPLGTPGMDYTYTNNAFKLPYLYIITCLAFLPPTDIIIGTKSNYDSQVADIITWNTISLNKFGPPLRLYSSSFSTAVGGVAQLINRNNTIYALTNGGTSLFETNGTNFQLTADLSLYMSVRDVNGAQVSRPIFMNLNPKAIGVIGNKLLTGMSTTTSFNYPTGFGPFPMGAWSIAFTDDGEAIQCEYPISTGTTVGINTYKIGAIQPNIQGQTLISWEDNGTYGIDMVDSTNYQTDISTVTIESELMEIGTALDPNVIQNIEVNLTRELLTGQIITVYARRRYNEDYFLVDTYIGDGTRNAYKTVKNKIGATQFVQFQVHMSTAVPNERNTPELRNFIIS